jgi:hypothetical protein
MRTWRNFAEFQENLGNLLIIIELNAPAEKQW